MRFNYESRKYYCGDATGSSNTYEINAGIEITALSDIVDGDEFVFVANHDNDGDSFVAINGLSSIQLLDKSGNALEGSEIYDGDILNIIYYSSTMYVQSYIRDNVNNMTLTSETFTSIGANTFNVPSNVSFVWLTLTGGGGGGAAGNGSDNTGGGGGGGGHYVHNLPLQVTPGEAISVTIGDGGAGGASDGDNGSDGNASSFGGYITCLGGEGGKSADSWQPAFGGRGGTTGGMGGDDDALSPSSYYPQSIGQSLGMYKGGSTSLDISGDSRDRSGGGGAGINGAGADGVHAGNGNDAADNSGAGGSGGSGSLGGTGGKGGSGWCKVYYFI